MNVYGDYPVENAVDIVLLPDGYTAQEMEKFKKDCQFFVQSLFSYAPYNRYTDRFNVRAVLVPSLDSDVTMPGDKLYRNTALSCSFWTFDSERYCMTYDNETMKTLAGQVPYDQIYILANTKKYGGGGIFNSYCVSTTGDSYASDVIIHEFGHGFAGLADEYAYDGTDNYCLEVEPWEPNITTLVDFESKWADLVAPETPIPTPNTNQYNNTVGAFEGGGYLTEGMYRPQRHCMMRDYAPFCAVCNRTIEAVIEAHSDTPVAVKSEQLLPESSLRVCPNPATEFIDVFVNQEVGQAEIIDMNGKTAMSVQLKNEVNRITISDLPNGMYLLRANGETRKFVKQ